MKKIIAVFLTVALVSGGLWFVQGSEKLVDMAPPLSPIYISDMAPPTIAPSTTA